MSAAPFSLAQVADEPSRHPTTRVPILIVNDNAAQRVALGAVLAPLGYAIVEADSGLAALRCVMADDFAVILLDVCMPEMDGFETAAFIRQRQESEMTPLIFITTYGSDELPSNDLYSEGAVDFIFAPVPPDELRAKVSVFGNLYIRAQELAARAEEVQTSADEFWLLTDAAPIGIFQTDPQNRYIYTNPRWTEITGIPPEEAAGQRWETIIGSEARAGLIAELHDGGDGGAEISRRFEIQVPDAATRIVRVTSKTIADSDGGVGGWVGTLADITAEAGAEAAMSEARDRATEASRLKSDFLANMSHEIRTPMNGVLGMADLLLETGLDTRQRDYAQTVRNSGEALLTIINDILDFSKVEAGKLEIEEIDFDLHHTIDDVVDLLAVPAQTKGLELVAVIERSLPEVIRGDPGRIRQILTNLIGNAIKFTQSGEIVLRVTEVAAGVGRDDTVVLFEVSDTGDGIEHEKLRTVFQPFVQADTSTSRKYGGTGLGLAISSQLVSLMGGDCGVRSELGAGSTFWFTIEAAASTAPAKHDLLGPDADFVGVHALIVDDNATVRAVLSDVLTDWGMEVATAATGEDALIQMRNAVAEGERFALALLDRSMPGMDGLALKNAIAADPDLSTRLLLMIDLGEERDLGPVAESGVAASLSKPVHLLELRACLRVALRLEEADIAPDAEAVEHDPSHGSSTGLVLLAEDNLINQKVAVAMLESAGFAVETVINGAEAVRAAAARAYDAILMDCQMPEMNGYQATAAIRAQEGAERRTPIIAMTAGARREDRARCLAEGMDSYLAKPVSKDALLALVRSSIKVRPALLDPPPAEAVTVARGAAMEITIDRTIFDELRTLGDDSGEDLVAEVTDTFVEDTEPLLVALRDAFELDDAYAVGRIAHSVKGGASQLGGRRLTASCGRLEGKATAGVLHDGLMDLEEIEISYQDLRRELSQHLTLTTDRVTS
jgi:two-component system, sensor histidine kinase and response regulator